MDPIFLKPNSLKDASTHYCAGCGHGIVHRLIAEIVDELDIREKVIGIAPVGCAVLAYDYWNFDVTEAAHGRVPAVATGIKRSRPETIVFGYQGDGDLAAIGTAEIIHAANRGENITIIFINNSVYGMTGGQMAPTTMLKQKTSTTQSGREQKLHGFPLKVCELLSILPGVFYAERVSVHSPQNVLKTKKAIKKAFQNQVDEKGFSIIEVLSQCPTYTGLSSKESTKWVGEEMTKQYPLGVFKE
ncbi:MAG: 2-oxoglutarate oxidoreductase [Candidatus Omnitrophica bacterium]|nr:2-oxoglutarate oxidoreductase [Candidatus Omnitrophota bacterium]